MSDIKKVVLAYSGGLDTSVIVRWLQDTYQCEVITFTADIGQGEEVEPARLRAAVGAGHGDLVRHLARHGRERAAGVSIRIHKTAAVEVIGSQRVIHRCGQD